MTNVLVLGTQEGDWEALYINGKLISEGHTIGDGDNLYLWRMGIKYGFGPNDIIYKELDDEDEEYAMNSGSMPKDITKYMKA